jgi:hypothetical protein
MQGIQVGSTTRLWRNDISVPDPLKDVFRLGLEKNVAELDANGFTVVAPDRVAPPEFIAELEAAMLRVGEARSGVKPDKASGASHRNLPSPAGQHMYSLLEEGEIFECAMMNEVVLTLMDYLLGVNCLISSMTGMLKGPGEVNLDLHADAAPMPPPLPAYAVGANATYAITDYSRENGSVCFWPGSHKFCRQPTREERENTAMLVPIDAPAGSLIVWHGNTWHGAFARTAPGLRINLIMFFCRPFMQRQEMYCDRIGADVLKRNTARFSRLVGLDQVFPMGREGPNRENFARLNAGAVTQWG